MKIIIEDADIASVKNSVEGYGVSLTDDQAKMLIENNSEIVAELLNGHIDNEEILISSLVDWVMKGIPRKDGYRWFWPDKISGKRYKEEFYSTFKRAAMEKGVVLIGDWE